MKEYSLKSSGGTGGGRVLALDLGIGSYGIALQTSSGHGEAREYSFPVVRSCTLPELWASLKEEGTRRRMYRTRKAHKAREAWLRHTFMENGLADAVLYGRQISEKRVKQPDGSSRYVLAKPGDFRLEREFPPKEGERTRDGAPSDVEGARIVYCGAVLRCLLLLGREAQITAQGRVLEPWQIFKALHSAIQKRGYDPDIPWMNVRRAPTIDDVNGKPRKAKKVSKSAVIEKDADDAAAAPVISEEELQKHEEEQISRARAEAMLAIIEGNAPDNERCQHPCFWEAARMGLWSGAEPERISNHYGHHAKSSKWADRDDPATKKKAGEQPKADAHRMPAVYPRHMVERELLDLCYAAEELLP